MKAKTKNGTPKFISLAIVCLLVSIGVAYLHPHLIVFGITDIGIKLSMAIVIIIGVYSFIHYRYSVLATKNQSNKLLERKLKSVMAISGFLTVIGSLIAPPIFFIIFLLASVIFSIIISVKKKIDLACILILLGFVIIFIEVWVLRSVTRSITGLVLIFAASAASLLEFSNPDLMKSKKFISGVLLVLVLFFIGFNLFGMKYAILIKHSEGPEIVPADWWKSIEYAISEQSPYYQELAKECETGDDCCLSSIMHMAMGNFKLEPESGCPEGFHRKGLNCPTTLVWCEPNKEETDPVIPVTIIAREHLQKYVHNAFPNVDFFSMVKGVGVVGGECEANHYWERWGQTTIESPSKHQCWIVKFYYPGPAGGSHLAVYVDKNTNKVIGGTQTR